MYDKLDIPDVVVRNSVILDASPQRWLGVDGAHK
jgi:hypothetical protein